MSEFHVTTMRAVVGGLYNLYSPHLGTGTLHVGGWRDAGQTEDRLYAYVGGQMIERLRRPGWHVNDPALVAAPDGSGWRCYYTGLSLTPVDAAHAAERPVLGLATSPDGIHWYDEGILVGRWNGCDLGAVWSPGAVVVGEEVWLYANSSAPLYRDYRLRLAADGRTVLATEALALDRVPGYYPFVSNLDVAPKADGPGYWLAANTSDGVTIQLCESDDGLAWRWVQVLITGAPSGTQAWTPHLVAVTPDGFDVLFGWTEVPGAYARSRSIHRWTWAR